MKLVRLGEPGQEKPGLVDANGAYRSLEGIVDDIGGAALAPDSLARLRGIDTSTLPLVDPNTRLGPCVADVRNFYGIGRNYADHAAEAKMELPKQAVIFNKATSSICGPNDNVIIPPGGDKVDWEVEMAVVIGSYAYNVSEEDALDYAAGYCVCNDISERAWQIEGTGHGVKGKSAPTFGPIGPWLVTADEIADPHDLDLYLELNGQRVQNSNTRHMVFNVRHLISFASTFMALLPGDIISTGTPSGIGMTMNPPRWLKPGDAMRLGVAGLGDQFQTCVAAA